MDSNDDEKPPKRVRLQNYDVDSINQPSTSGINPCKSQTLLEQMDPSLLSMTVEEILLLLLSDPKSTFSCPIKMGIFYRKFLICILSVFKETFGAYAENIEYLQEKINDCHFELLQEMDIEHYADNIIDHYETIVFNELGSLSRNSDDKRFEISRSLLNGIDSKLTKLIKLKNFVTEQLVDVGTQPVVNEVAFMYQNDDYNNIPIDDDYDNVPIDDDNDYDDGDDDDDDDDDDSGEKDIVYPVLYAYNPLLIIEADIMTDIFNDTTLRRLVELSKEDYQNFQNPPDVITESSINGNELIPMLAANDDNIEIAEEAEFQSDYEMIFEELESRVSCLKVLNNLCLIGCIDGVLRLGSLESMRIIDSFQAHNLSITSITTWNKRIFTTSFDKTIRCFNLESQCVKKLGLLDSLTCADHDGDGILYAGTSKGHVYQLNMLALTIITPFVQVSSEPIDNIIILRADHPVIRKMLICTDNAVTLRDCSSGGILLALRFDNVVLCTYSPTTNKIFAASDCIYQANALENDRRVIQLLPFSAGGTSILYNHGVLLVSDNYGNTIVFDEDLNFLRLLRGAQNDVITCMAPWKNYVISYFSESGFIGKAILRRQPAG